MRIYVEDLIFERNLKIVIPILDGEAQIESLVSEINERIRILQCFYGPRYEADFRDFNVTTGFSSASRFIHSSNLE